jgi:hypothetical protein
MRTQSAFSRSSAGSTARASRLVLPAALLLLLLVLAACAPLQAPGQAAGQSYGGVVESVLNFNMPEIPPTPTPAPTPEEQVQVIVSTGGSRANIRSAPSLDGAIVGKADNGTALNVVGRSADNAWWQVCCVDGVEGWVADSIVRVAGEGDAVPVAADIAVESEGPLFDSDLQATWEIAWSCTSEEGRCTVPACDAVVTAGVQRQGDGQFVPVEYNVEWSDECFSTDSWVFEVNPLTGRERTGEYADNFLYAYWAGAESGDISGVFPFGDEQGIVVSCSGPDTVEIEEGDGWTSSYEGITCHDRRTGMLVYMDYVKRWLFTGQFEGKEYERAYFGDTEKLEQRLVETNAELFFVERK